MPSHTKCENTITWRHIFLEEEEDLGFCGSEDTSMSTVVALRVVLRGRRVSSVRVGKDFGVWGV